MWTQDGVETVSSRTIEFVGRRGGTWSQRNKHFLLIVSDPVTIHVIHSSYLSQVSSRVGFNRKLSFPQGQGVRDHVLPKGFVATLLSLHTRKRTHVRVSTSKPLLP